MRALLLASMLLIAAPASAQIWDGGRDATGAAPARGFQPREGTDGIRDAIRDGRDSGQLTRTDAKRLRREAGQIDSLAARYGRDGLSDAEAAELAVRQQVLREDVTATRSGQRK